MTETTQRSDMATGLGMLFGFVVALAAIATAATAFVAVTDHSDTMQILSGVGLSVAILAGGLSIVAIHVFE
jgi:hypothetical protein